MTVENRRRRSKETKSLRNSVRFTNIQLERLDEIEEKIDKFVTVNRSNKPKPIRVPLEKKSKK